MGEAFQLDIFQQMAAYSEIQLVSLPHDLASTHHLYFQGTEL